MDAYVLEEAMRLRMGGRGTRLDHSGKIIDGRERSNKSF